MVWAALEISIRCPHCDSPVHVDGPYTEVLCPSCQSPIAYPPEIWKDTLEDVSAEVPGLEPNEGNNSTIFGHFNMTMMTGRQVPRCRKCRREFDMDAEYRGQDVMVCPACGDRTPVFPAPEWLKEAVHGATLVVGAWPMGGSVEEEAGLSGPVAFSCPQCAGSLMIDGRDRLVKCSFCGTNVYLPDDLWLRIHPAKKKGRWYIGLDEALADRPGDDEDAPVEDDGDDEDDE